MSCFVTQTVPKIFHSHKSHKLRSWNPQMYFTRNISEAVNQISELLFHCDLFLISLIIIFKIYLLTYRDRVQLCPVHTGGEKWMSLSDFVLCEGDSLSDPSASKKWKMTKSCCVVESTASRMRDPEMWFFYELCNWKKFQEHKVRRRQKERGCL